MSSYKGGSPEVTNYPSHSQNFLFALTWVICGFLTVLIPLIFRTIKKNQYENMYYMYNWEEAQQQYEEQQKEYYEQMYQNQNMNGGQYGGGQWGNGQWGNYGYQWEQMRGNYDINQCQWYQFNCFPYYINEKGEPEPRAGWYPSWYSGWAKTEEEKEQMIENGETSSALMFVYIWQIVMFITILVYGYVVIRQNRVITGVLIALVVYANMSFLSMWMLADGTIVTDGEMVQKTGFYGQFSVLMFITNAWYVIFGIVFSCLFAIRGHQMHEKRVPKENQKQLDDESYRQMA